MTWRAASAPIIAQVIAETGRGDMKLLKKKLREAFPWGDHRHHPWKIYYDECQRQLGLKPPLRHSGRKPEPVPEEQGKLFQD